ncbi:MAG TPA: hypothetical protein VN577_22950 [Terriglobales bacterium]|nr:hypothetical protein [Terriglobales bacterium]
MAAPITCSNPVCCERVVSVLRQVDPPCCVLANRAKVRLPQFLAPYLTPGDELAFPVPEDQAKGAEIYVRKRTASTTEGNLYLAPIGYVTPPKTDKRDRWFVSAEVQRGGLGISGIYLPCHLLREYFYCLPQSGGKAKYPTFYELLGVSPGSSPAEMRVAFKLRCLELQSAGSGGKLRTMLERAFNILAQPELRTCYDTLLLDAEAAAVFPYGGFGSLLVSGAPSHDGVTFFARRILAYRPNSRPRRFHVQLRKCEFYQNHALCRDVARHLEFWINPAVVPLVWDASWNRWKHLLGVKMEVEGWFIESGRYRKRLGEWGLVSWEAALPSRLHVRLPPGATEQIAHAHNTYQRFGQYSRALDQVRLLLEHRAVEKTDLERICVGLKIPSDFDIAQINWRPDYDPFFYGQLSRRARRIYLFRGEYIFDLEKAVAVETPQLGHATYVFAKPRNMESFLHLYTHVSKEDIRRNQENVAERLGFLKRVIHGDNARAWLKDIKQQLGEALDFTSADE